VAAVPAAVVPPLADWWFPKVLSSTVSEDLRRSTSTIQSKPSCYFGNQARFYRPKGPHRGKRIDLFDSTYSHFTKQVLETIRKETSVRTSARTVGPQSRNMIGSFRGLTFDLSITFLKWLVAPADPRGISPIALSCRVTGIDANEAGVATATLSVPAPIRLIG
jgi:hypothetical protein